VTSALLVVAVVGAVVLARRPHRANGGSGAPTGAVVEPDDGITGPDITGLDDVEAGTAGGEPDVSEPGVSEPGVSEPGGALADLEVSGP
jgi:hypothetical protein